MVRMNIVDWVVLAFAHICSKGLATIRFGRVICLSKVFDKILYKWIWAGRIMWGIGQSKDVIVLANGEPLDLTEFRVLEFVA